MLALGGRRGHRVPQEGSARLLLEAEALLGHAGRDVLDDDAHGGGEIGSSDGGHAQGTEAGHGPQFRRSKEPALAIEAVHVVDEAGQLEE